MAAEASAAATRTRPRVVLLTTLAALMLAVAVVLAVAARTNSHAGPDTYRGSQPPGTYELPQFALTNYGGSPVTSHDLRGHVVVLTLLDAQCKEACPIIASVVARTVDRLAATERRDVRAVAITTDPAEDTPAAVRTFLTRQRADGRLEYLLGSERELRPLWKALLVLPSLDTGQDSTHSAPVRIYGRDGVWASTLHAGVDLDQANLLHDIRLALRTDAE